MDVSEIKDALCQCRICLEQKRSCNSIYEIVLERYLPSVIEYICGVQISALDEPESLVCISCSMALIQAEEIIRKFRTTQELLAGQTAVIAAQLEMLKDGEQVYEKLEEIAIKDKDTYDQEENTQLLQDNIETIKWLGHQNPVNSADASESTGSESADSESVNEESLSEQNDSSEQELKVISTQKYITKAKRRCHLNLGRLVNRKKDFHFRCEHCPFESEFAKYFRNHMVKEHKVDKPRIFKCSQCSEAAYMEHRSLIQHIRYVHEREPRHMKYLCSDCGKGFTKNSHLVRHSYVHRPEDRPFKCEVCPMLFVNMSSVKRHMIASHSKNKPYVCDQCGAAFGVIYGLRAHMKRVHIDKPFTCPKCKISFRLHQSLDTHLRACNKKV